MALRSEADFSGKRVHLPRPGGVLAIPIPQWPAPRQQGGVTPGTGQDARQPAQRRIHLRGKPLVKIASAFACV